MFKPIQTASYSKVVVPPWQGLRSGFRSVFFAFAVVVLSATSSPAQIYDSLDAYPPRWHLDTSDCDARVVSHKHLADGGVDGRGCEVITIAASHGTEAIIAYPIEPILPIDGLTANVSVMSAQKGARIGFRVRFPYLRDESTHRAEAVILYGAAYNDPGQFRSIGIGMIERALRLKTISLRSRYGSDADVRDPYVDAVVLNAYGGAGMTSLRVDELRVDGVVSISDVSDSLVKSASDLPEALTARANRVAASGQQTSMLDGAETHTGNAFPLGRVTRLLQHNGEPLNWVRSLGFDAVLLSKPPDAEILNEAIRARVMLYAPPPSSPDPALQPLLQPVAGWYLGGNETLDATKLSGVEMTSRRVRRFPAQWQRPLVASPVESHRQYASLVDAILCDLPIRSRGVTGKEESAELARVDASLAGLKQIGTAVMSMPAESVQRQAELIAGSIGAPPQDSFRWHSMWLQTMRSLRIAPSAILFRSTRPLTSGTEIENQRSMALSYVNRMIAMAQPWIADATPHPARELKTTDYLSTQLVKSGTEVLILTSEMARGSEVLAGDGQTIEIDLAPSDSNKTFWRLTHFSAERMAIESTPTGTRLNIVSPDAVELIVASSDPSMGAKLQQSAGRFSRQASMDRWQLSSDLVRRTENQWQTVVGARITRRAPPADLIQVAARSIADAEPLYRAGDHDASLRMARRADAWALRSQWQLSEALMPDWPRLTSSPPMDCGAIDTQTLWFPLMQEHGWSENYLPVGSLDSPEMLSPDRWSFGKRLHDRAFSEVAFASRGSYSGPGAMVATTNSLHQEPLPGGYEGTVLQIRSPAVRVPANTAVRIDALVRTIGFGQAHQGVLVFDNLGGQEMGVLVRGRSTWTPVRLYRQTTDETEIKVMFELLGGGEAMIDEVELRIWQPEQANKTPLPLRPIVAQPR